MKSRSWFTELVALLACLMLVFAAAGLGAMASVQAASFYAQLSKPVWGPPAWVFGPVWSLLYLLMGLALWLVWRSSGPKRLAISLFLLQLAANALWSWLFFAWRCGAWAAVEVLLLWALIGATMLAFHRCSPWAARLLWPYWLWVSFASVLTWVIWRANPLLLACA